MTAQTFTIPTPPSSNALYANARKGRRKTAAYKAWITEAGLKLNLQRVRPVTGAVVIELRIKRPTANSDASNRIKAAEDLLVRHGLINDDRETHKISVEWAEVDGCEVTLRART